MHRARILPCNAGQERVSRAVASRSVQFWGRRAMPRDGTVATLGFNLLIYYNEGKIADKDRKKRQKKSRVRVTVADEMMMVPVLPIAA